MALSDLVARLDTLDSALTLAEAVDVGAVIMEATSILTAADIASASTLSAAQIATALARFERIKERVENLRLKVIAHRVPTAAEIGKHNAAVIQRQPDCRRTIARDANGCVNRVEWHSAALGRRAVQTYTCRMVDGRLQKVAANLVIE